MNAGDIVAGAPAWVYVLLVVLIALGLRRVRTREMPQVVALIPSVAFLAWSLVGVAALANRAGVAMAAGSWVMGLAVGLASGIVLPEARGERLPRARVRLPGSWVPLILYVGVFVVRFACGAWAAIFPRQSDMATAIGIAAGAAVMARLLVGIVRWRTALPTRDAA